MIGQQKDFNAIARQHYFLANDKDSFSETQLRFFLALLVRVKQNETNPPMKLDIHVSEFLPGHPDYKAVWDSSDNIMKRIVAIEKLTPRKKRSFMFISIVTSFSYRKGSEYVSCSLNGRALPYLVALTQKLTLTEIERLRNGSL